MTTTICALCSSLFEARNSYGLCPSCWTRDRLREYDRVTTARYNALRLNLTASLTLREWLSITSDFNGLCAYCLHVPFSRIEIVTLHTGLVYGNVVPCCKPCAVHKERTFDAAVERIQRYLDNPRTMPLESEEEATV